MSAARQRVLVIGDGIAGLASARALVRRGFAARVLGRRLPGAASGAAAGLLAPSLGEAAADVRALMRRGRDAWPPFAAELARDSGRALEVNRLGILEVAPAEDTLERLTAARPPWAELLDRRALAALEPALAGAAGAVRHPDDGAVDNEAVLAALDVACDRTEGLERVHRLATRVELGGRVVRVEADDGEWHEGDLLVVAAGAWAHGVAGLPNALPVAPKRGQMLALEGAPVRHCLAGGGAYVVPRGGRVLVGSTLEDVGFEVATTERAIAGLRARAAALVPALADAPESARWAGLRPMTPDALPFVGRDPDDPRVVHAAGLSKNGILLAPLVADAVGALAAGEERPELRPFAVERLRG